MITIFASTSILIHMIQDNLIHFLLNILRIFGLQLGLEGMTNFMASRKVRDLV